MSESSGGGARTCCLIKTWLFNTKPSETINCYQWWWWCVWRALSLARALWGQISARHRALYTLYRYCVDILDILTTLDTIHSHAPLASWTSVGLRPSGRHHLPTLHQAGLLQTHRVTTVCHPYLTSHNLISPQNTWQENQIVRGRCRVWRH